VSGDTRDEQSDQDHGCELKEVGNILYRDAASLALRLVVYFANHET